MTSKIKKFCINIGQVVAILLMLGPVMILNMADELNTQSFLFYFLASIFYDFFLYSVIQQNNYIEENKELFQNVYNGKTINSKTHEEKQKWYEVICIDMFMNYFNDNNKK